jgi:hypothetical protein
MFLMSVRLLMLLVVASLLARVGVLVGILIVAILLESCRLRFAVIVVAFILVMASMVVAFILDPQQGLTYFQDRLHAVRLIFHQQPFSMLGESTRADGGTVCAAT